MIVTGFYIFFVLVYMVIVVLTGGHDMGKINKYINGPYKVGGKSFYCKS